VDKINWHTFFFLLFALVACAFSVAVVATGNIVRMAFYLVLALGATAGLFFMAGASFVGAMQLLIYVGGTLVLLIFGVMLTAQGPFVSMKTRSGEWVLAVIVGGSLLAVLVQAAFSVKDWRGDERFAHATAITGSPSRPNGQVVIRATEAGTKLVGYQVVFERTPSLESPAQCERGGDKTLTVYFRDDATAADVVSAVNALQDSSMSAIRAELPPGSEGTGLVTAKDDTRFAIRAPRGDTAPGPLGLALLGARTDDPDGQHGPVKKSGYLLPFEIISVHLLVVLIAAAYLARAKRRRIA
jgi:NADH:ubiquinone oxidoreductase subunit 6 (subunit J)